LIVISTRNGLFFFCFGFWISPILSYSTERADLRPSTVTQHTPDFNMYITYLRLWRSNNSGLLDAVEHSGPRSHGTR
jgi:hypothetical protein